MRNYLVTRTFKDGSFCRFVIASTSTAHAIRALAAAHWALNLGRHMPSELRAKPL
jgi:hypothetical protein